MRLSVLDASWPGNLADTVTELDRLGFYRYWATEHHSRNQSGSPVIIAALAAGLTEKLIVGTAGVLLNFNSPYKIAEDFRVLELFFPGRIDLGIIGAAPEGEVGTALLDGRNRPSVRSYGTRIQKLARIMYDSDPPIGLPAPGPFSETNPTIWICGSSARSAELAGRFGLAYSFHQYIYEHFRGLSHGEEIIDAYTNNFRQTYENIKSPLFNIACFGICAETEQRAKNLWNERQTEEGISNIQSSFRQSFIGTPEQCVDQICGLQRRYDTKEIVLQCLTKEFRYRLQSYALLSEELRLKERAPQA